MIATDQPQAPPPEGFHREDRRLLSISEPQARFLQALDGTDPVIGYVGGRGAGKSYIGGYGVATRADPGDKWMCVSPDAGVVHDTTLPTFLDIVQDLGMYHKHVLTPYPRVWWFPPVKLNIKQEPAQMVFRSGEKPDKLRGPNKSGLWIDEASIQSHEVFQIARATLRHRGVMGPTLLTFTPRGRQHWTFDAFYQKAPEGYQPQNGEVSYFQGTPYLSRQTRTLVTASTKENPFLPREFYEEQRSNYSGLLAAQELEGDFVDIAGLMFMRHWFRMCDAAPRDAMRVRYWDRACTPTEGASYTAGVRIARDQIGRFYIEDVVRGRWSAHERDEVIKQTAHSDAHRFNNETLIYVEQEGGSGGKEVMEQLIRKLAGFPVYRDLATSSTRTVGGVKLPGQPKITRAQPLAAQAEAGNVFIVSGDWNAEFLNEMVQFPESAYADQVDACAAGLNRLAALCRPEDAISQKTRHSVSSSRFGKTMTLAEEPKQNFRRGSRPLFGRG